MPSTQFCLHLGVYWLLSWSLLYIYIWCLHSDWNVLFLLSALGLQGMNGVLHKNPALILSPSLLAQEGDDKIEYRAWNPFRSKLAAAILGGVDQIHIKPGAKVLYLGAASGTTVSHVSDIVGPVSGQVLGIEGTGPVYFPVLCDVDEARLIPRSATGTA